jgi:hypothetical protein
MAFWKPGRSRSEPCLMAQPEDCRPLPPLAVTAIHGPGQPMPLDWALRLQGTWIETTPPPPSPTHAGSGKGALVSPRHGCRFSTPSLEVARAARLSYAMAVANGAHPTRADSFPHAATSSLNIVIVSAPRYCSDPVTRMNSRLTPPPRSEHRWAASQQLSPSNAFHRRTPTTSHSSSAILRHVCMTRAPASSQAATHSPSSNATTSADALSPSHRCVASTSTAKARWCTLRTCART